MVNNWIESRSILYLIVLVLNLSGIAEVDAVRDF